jgi:Holliday junction resolvase RusA-like endonuclease
VRIPRFKARGDLDNQLKTVLDSLEEAGVLENDSQIYSINISSWYCKKGELPITEIKIVECSDVIWRV